MANEFKVKKGLTVNGSGSTLLDIQGSQGQLFSVTDQLTGTLFSVSDISGIPILEVDSDDTIRMGTFGSEAIIVSGSHATVSGSFSGSFQGDGQSQWDDVTGGINYANGNVGVGTTSPTGVLDVLSTDAQRYARFRAPNGEERFQFYIGSTGNSSVLNMFQSDGTTQGVKISSEGTSYLNGGNVGIGITVPLHDLSIEGTSSSLLKIRNTTNGGGAAIEFNDNSSAATTQNGTLTYYHSDSASQGGGASWHFESEPDTVLVVGSSTVSGRVVVKDGGNNAEVAYGFYDDINTGMYRAGADSLRLVAGGVSGVSVSTTGVGLRYAGSTKIVTSNSGITITGTATATTFSGDLNGTINTATTAVTKPNATDDDTVATTAFVKNLIETIPAGLVFQGTWNADTNTPTLANGTGTTGHFYIVSTEGSTNLDGITDWKVGDWAVFVEQGATDAWEKVDNSSVLDGSGTGQTVALWGGSGTSNTLTDAPITVSSNNTTFAGTITLPSNKSVNWPGGSIRAEGNTLKVTATTLIDLQEDTQVQGTLQATGQISGSSIQVVGGGTNNFFSTSTNAIAEFKPSDTRSGIQPILVYRASVNGSANYMLTSGANTLFGLYDSGVPSDVSGMVKITPNNTSEAPTVHIGDAGSNAAALNVGGNIKLLNNGISYINGGNVGIGTTSPSEKLEVVGKILTTANSTALAAGYFATLSSDYATNTLKLTSKVGDVFRATNFGRDVSILTGTSATTEKMRILANGNVGIGTPSPTSKLTISSDVAGDGSWNDSGILIENTSTTSTGEPTLSFRNAGAAGTGANYWHTGLNQSTTYKIAYGTSFTDGGTKLELGTNGNFRLNAYGLGNLGGTGNFLLGVTTTGDIYEANAADLPGGPYLPLTGGTMTGTNGVVLPDNFKLNLGNSSDLQIYHDGSNSYINQTGTGKIIIQSTSGINVQSGTGETRFTYSGVNSEIKIDDSAQVNKVVLKSTGYSYFNGGNVGIGTTTPSQKLEVSTDAEMVAKFAGNTDDGTGYVGAVVEIESNNDSRGRGVYLTHRLTTDTSDSEWYAGVPYTGGGYSIGNAAYGTSINSNTGPAHKDQSKLFITEAGNVGIGTTSPGYKLHVNGGGLQTTTSTLNRISYYDGSGIGAYSSTGWNIGNYIGDLSLTNNADDKDIIFKASAGTAAPAEIMRIDGSAGNVGIGTTSPSYKLQVAGGISAGGKATYSKSAGSLDTTGYAVAGLTTSFNGQSAGFTFTCFGHTGKYQKIVYSCWNAAGAWNTSKVIDEGTNDFDIEASANGTTITFTFKSRSGTKSYTPRVTVEATGTAINNTYA